MDVVVLEENTTCARIFSEDDINLLEHAYGTQCHIFKITDRCRNYIQHQYLRLSILTNNSYA